MSSPTYPLTYKFRLTVLLFGFILTVIVLTACSKSPAAQKSGAATEDYGVSSASPTETGIPNVEETGVDVAAPTINDPSQGEAAPQTPRVQSPDQGQGALKTDGRQTPADWKQWPVVPEVSSRAKEIFEAGIVAGNDPHHFSVLGDCQAPEWKLFGMLDWDSYELDEEYAYLQPTIEYYRGQWDRRTYTIIYGNTVATLFSVYWADQNACEPGENPIECEFRINNPNLVVMMLGTNWKGEADEFEKGLREAVDYILERDILPILVTKADSHGPDWPLNQAIVRVAYDYDLPLWNFWSAVQDMPNHGMDPDDPRHIHLDPQAYAVKRITGLQALDAVLQAVYTEP